VDLARASASAAFSPRASEVLDAAFAD